MTAPHQVLLFYKYITIDAPDALAAWLRERAEAHALAGRAIIAHEGINATLEGTVEATEAFAAEFSADPRFADVSIKRSASQGSSFPKLSVKVRDEIVGTRFPKDLINPERRTAPRISARKLREQLARDEDLVIIDMRNEYEFRSGHFKGSVNPGLSSSRDLPRALPKLEPYKQKKVVTVCTGGIRCEKMSAFLMENGFTNVSQLEDGIHAYMEAYPGEDFLGTLYTFDKRKTMHFGGEREVVGRCYLCEAPTEEYANCANDACHLHFLVCAGCMGETGTYCSNECIEKAALPEKGRISTERTLSS